MTEDLSQIINNLPSNNAPTSTTNTASIKDENIANNPPNTTSSQHTWLEDLPDELKNHKSLSKFADNASLAKSYLELERNYDKRIALPSQDATDEEWNKFMYKLGCPEDKKYFSEERKAELIKSNLADNDSLSFYENLFYLGGLTKKQGEKILKQIIDTNLEQTKKAKEAYESERISNFEKFNKTYGDSASEKLNILKATMQKHGNSDLVNLVEDSNYSPVLIDLLLKLGENLKSDSLISGKNDNNFINDKESAIAEIKRLESDKDFMLKYSDKNHAGYSDSLARMQYLYNLAYNK